MRSQINKATKELKEELKKSFPDLTIRVMSPVADADKLIEVVFPKVYSRSDWEKVVSIQSEIEDKYKVTFAVIPLQENQIKN